MSLINMLIVCVVTGGLIWAINAYVFSGAKQVLSLNPEKKEQE